MNIAENVPIFLRESCQDLRFAYSNGKEILQRMFLRLPYVHPAYFLI